MDLGDVVAVLAAIGHEIRFEVWRTLMACGPLGLSVGVLAARLAVAPSSLSFHLRQMTRAKVLVQRRSSRQIIYAANNEIMNSLCMFLENTAKQCDNSGLLDRFREE